MPNMRHHRWDKEDAELAIHHETLSFDLNGKRFDFVLIHNFNMFNLDIYKALNEWVHKTHEYNIDSFCLYIFNNMPYKKVICIPEDEWNEFQINQNLQKEDFNKFK